MLENYEFLLKKSTPIEEKFIRISSVYSLEHLFYNFKFKTSTQETFMCICTALGNTDDLWKFLENICDKNFENSIFISEQEGPESILIAQKIDDTNIRFTIINDRWMKHNWNKETKNYKFEAQHTKEYDMEIVFDIILSKKDFIYTFYLELYDIFYGTDIEAGAALGKAQTDSETIKNYLRYIPATEIDFELEKLLKDGNLDKIETVLKNGANPNAVINVDKLSGSRELIINEALKAVYVDNNYSPFIMGSAVENLSEEEILKLKKKLKPYKEELLLHNFEIIKLLFKYGAKPISIYNAVYPYYSSGKFDLVKWLLDDNCEYDDKTINLVASNLQVQEDFNNSEKNLFKKYYNMIDEYLFNVSYQIDYDPTMLQKY